MRHKAKPYTHLLRTWLQQRVIQNVLQVLSGVLDRVSSQLAPLLDTAHASESGQQSFDFLGNSLLPEVDSAIASNLASENPSLAFSFRGTGQGKQGW